MGFLSKSYDVATLKSYDVATLSNKSFIDETEY